MSEVVTADMIDDELVGRIYDQTMFASGYLSHSEPFIRSILAWLANNPVVPSDEEIFEFTREIETERAGHGSFPRQANILEKFQRIAYLKKEDEFPRELINFSGCSPDIKAAILKGYKLGKESK